MNNLDNNDIYSCSQNPAIGLELNEITFKKANRLQIRFILTFFFHREIDHPRVWGNNGKWGARSTSVEDLSSDLHHLWKEPHHWQWGRDDLLGLADHWLSNRFSEKPFQRSKVESDRAGHQCHCLVSTHLGARTHTENT